ncbi:MAG: DUF533 domain-containing protein [Hyphomicrobiaceae bacterium]|nr:DUF533 domain-containing protein [Hyphomicrobiaceae bacterium]
MPAFDARSILDAMIVGSSEQTRSARESGGLGDIMGDILGQLKGDGNSSQSGRFERADPYKESQRYDERQSSEQARPRNPLDDLFGQITGRRQSEQRQQVDYDERAAPSQGNGYGDLLGRVKDLVGNNQTAAGAIIGGLGGLLLGTKTGRSVLGRAARLGGLALIGTLAYKAYKKHQQGSSYQSGGQDDDRFGVPEMPPSGSGFEENSMTNDDAELFIRTMVSAAAADGQIDREEQQKILGNLEEAGMDDGAMDFLAGEFNNPASIEDIVAAVRTREQATKVYTAARIAIEPDTREEQQFLSYLSEQLDLDTTLAAYIDGQASAIKVR